VISGTDALQQLLIDFFDLPPKTAAGDLRQEALAKWDSLAMVQLISELQAAFGVEFELEEIEHLRSYDEIRAALERKGIEVDASR
jgi:acyl carrier protein